MLRNCVTVSLRGDGRATSRDCALLLVIALVSALGCEGVHQPRASVRSALTASLKYEDQCFQTGHEYAARGAMVDFWPWGWAWREGQRRFEGGTWDEEGWPPRRVIVGRIAGKLSEEEMLEYFRLLFDEAHVRELAAKNGLRIVDVFSPEDLAWYQVRDFLIDRENRRVLGLELLGLLVSLRRQGVDALRTELGTQHVDILLEEFVPFPAGTPPERYDVWFEQHKGELRWVEQKGKFALP